MSFCFLYNVVSENHSVQNSPWGGGGSIASSRSICESGVRVCMSKTITKSGYLTPLFARQCNAVCPFRLLALIVQRYSQAVSVVILSFFYFRFSNKYRGFMAL